MNRTNRAVAIVVLGASVAAGEVPPDSQLPVSAIAAPVKVSPASSVPNMTVDGDLGPFRRKLSSERAAKELRGLSVELARLTEDVYHMGLAPQELEDLGWKMSMILRKTETDLESTKKAAKETAMTPDLEPAARAFLKNAQDLFDEFLRLEIVVPQIQAQIGYANEDARQFPETVGQAKGNAAAIVEVAQSLLSRLK